MYHVCTAISCVTVIKETINELLKVAETAIRIEGNLEQALILHLQLQFSFHCLF